MRTTTALVPALTLVAAVAAAQPPTYSVTEISSPTAYSLQARALNNGGQVVGAFAVGSFIPQTGTPAHAFLYSNGVVQDLFPTDSLTSFSEARSINDLGQVVGYRSEETPMGPGQPFLYENGVAQTLNPFGVIPLALAGAASGINNAGQIAGITTTPSFTSHAFLLSPPVTPATDLHPDPAGVYFSSGAVALNDDGLVVGILGKPGHLPDLDTQDSFLWDGQSLSLLDGLLSGGGSFTPSAINAAGHVAGSSNGGASPEHAVVYANGAFTALADLAGATASRASGINADGVVTGTAVRPDGSRAVGWWDGVPHDLNALLLEPADVVLEEASAVNDAGQVIAWGTDRTNPSNVRIRSFLLAPVSAATVLGDLIDLVVAMDLPHGTETSLLSKLEAAQAALAAGDTATACASLQGFINEARAQSGKKIPVADAEAVIAAAERIRGMLGCS